MFNFARRVESLRRPHLKLIRNYMNPRRQTTKRVNEYRMHVRQNGLDQPREAPVSYPGVT